LAKADYRFFREGEEKDPMIHALMTEAQRQGNLGPEQMEKIAYDSGVSVGTLYGWWFGKTRHPQALTIRFVAEALDCQLKLVRNDGTTVKEPRQ
jgi:hypothetical protein